MTLRFFFSSRKNFFVVSSSVSRRFSFSYVAKKLNSLEMRKQNVINMKLKRNLEKSDFYKKIPPEDGWRIN